MQLSHFMRSFLARPLLSSLSSVSALTRTMSSLSSSSASSSRSSSSPSASSNFSSASTSHSSSKSSSPLQSTNNTMYLAQYIARAGVASRRSAHDMIMQGRVTVNGQVTNNQIKVSDGDVVTLDGKQLHHSPSRVYLYHKPAGELTSHSDPQGRRTVTSSLVTIMGEDAKHLHSVGRLDYHTSGLLLLTNDASIKFFMEHPQAQIERTYVVRVRGQLSEDTIEQLQQGITIDGFNYKPMFVQPLSSNANSGKNTYIVRIHEGKNREVRVILSSCGHDVMELKRVGYGPFIINDERIANKGENMFNIEQGELMEVQWSSQLEHMRQQWMKNKAPSPSAHQPRANTNSFLKSFSTSIPANSPSLVAQSARSFASSAIDLTQPSSSIRPSRNLSFKAASLSPAPASAAESRPPSPTHTHSKKCGCGEDHTAEFEQVSIESVGAADASGRPWSVDQMLDHNQQFVKNQNYQKFLTDRLPFKKLVIVTCMDTRLTELLPRALDISNGDAKIVKVAGAMVAHPFGSVMRSVLVAVYGLGAENIAVIGHHDCGMTGLDGSKIIDKAKSRGVSNITLETLNSAGLNMEAWLTGFESVQSSVRASVVTIRNHPLLKNTTPKLKVHGFVICPTTGKLDVVDVPEDI